MYKILAKEELAPRIKKMWVEAPRVAQQAKPGHFIIIRLHERGERIPLTIADMDPQRGAIMMVFQEMGKTTEELGSYRVGDSIADVLGPLGKIIPPRRVGTVLCVGGGVGVAPIYPRARELCQVGNRVIAVVGSRCKDLLIMQKEMEEVCHEVHYCTDDGSFGHHGLVTDLLPQLIEQERPAEVLAIGPVPMMRAVVQVTRQYNIPTIVSLNAMMVDGTGMCGACRVTVGGEVRFTCVDGPEFDGHQVDFAQLASRLRQFTEEERLALQRYRERREGCRCQTTG